MNYSTTTEASMQSSIYKYTVAELLYDENGEDRPELHQGQADSCYLEENGLRYWVSRTGVMDGEPFENTVTVETTDEQGRWVTVAIYDGDNIDDEMPV